MYSIDAFRPSVLDCMNVKGAGTNLQDGQLMHLLVSAGRDHVFEYAKLFVHLRSSPSLNQTVCCFPCNFATSSRGVAGLFPLPSRLLCLTFCIRLVCLCSGRFLSILRFHLYDLARSRWRRWKGVVILGYDTLLRCCARTLAALAGFRGSYRRSGRGWAIRRI